MNYVWQLIGGFLPVPAVASATTSRGGRCGAPARPFAITHGGPHSEGGGRADATIIELL